MTTPRRRSGLPFWVGGALLTLVVASCAVVSCTVLNSFSDLPVTTGVGGQGGSTCTDLGDSCSSCQLTACPGIYCACWNNTECKLLAYCLGNCANEEDIPCLEACLALHSDGITDSAMVLHCAGTLCAAVCPDAAPLSPCWLCSYEHCSQAMNNCLGDSSCFAIQRCVEECTDEECALDCYTSFPAGVGLATAVSTCQAVSCSLACPFAG